MNADLEVCGAMLNFGPSCVRKAGRSESRSAAGRFYLLVRLSRTGSLCFTRGSLLRCRPGVTAARPQCTHCPPGGLPALIQRSLICIFKRVTAPTQKAVSFLPFAACRTIKVQMQTCFGPGIEPQGSMDLFSKISPRCKMTCAAVMSSSSIHEAP